MSKHTPGPWFVRKWDGEEWPEKRISIGPEGKAVMITPRYADDAALADATVAAAAPELLEALESIVADFEFCKRNPGYGDRTEVYAETARASIAKARGES